MESTRESALREAATILAVEGYPSLTLERVANAVGVKTASLYHHFASRDALITEVMARGAEAVTADVVAALETVPTVQHLRRLETAIRAQFGAVAQHAPFTVANLRNIDQLPGELREAVIPSNRRLGELWEQIFSDVTASDVFPSFVDVSALKHLVLAAMTAIGDSTTSTGRPSPVELGEQLVELVRGAAVGPSREPSGVVSVDVGEGIGRITLRNPPVNSLTNELVAGLAAAIETLVRSDARVVIVQSSSDGEFCGGADLSLLRHLDPTGFETYLLDLRAVFERLATAPFPTIAAIDGPAMGCGLELAIACTFRVASVRASFSIPEVRMGLSPGAGTTERLPRLVGQQVALDLVLSGRAIDAVEAHAVGLVDRFGEGDLDEVVTAWAVELAGSSRIALAAALRSVRDSRRSDNKAELREAVLLFGGEAAAEAIEARAVEVSGPREAAP